MFDTLGEMDVFGNSEHDNPMIIPLNHYFPLVFLWFPKSPLIPLDGNSKGPDSEPWTPEQWLRDTTAG